VVIISACLAGVQCRYDGSARPDPKLRALIASGAAHLLVCPECMAGLPIPRESFEIVGGSGGDVLEGRARVLSKSGADGTAQFVRGAEQVLAMARKAGAKKAYLKSKSPSCGVGRIYDGSFSGRLAPGNGVLAELLQKNGIQVIEID